MIEFVLAASLMWADERGTHAYRIDRTFASYKACKHDLDEELRVFALSHDHMAVPIGDLCEARQKAKEPKKTAESDPTYLTPAERAEAKRVGKAMAAKILADIHAAEVARTAASTPVR